LGQQVLILLQFCKRLLHVLEPSRYLVPVLLITRAVDDHRAQALELPDAAEGHLLHHVPHVSGGQFMSRWQLALQKVLTLLGCERRQLLG